MRVRGAVPGTIPLLSHSMREIPTVVPTVSAQLCINNTPTMHQQCINTPYQCNFYHITHPINTYPKNTRVITISNSVNKISQHTLLKHSLLHLYPLPSTLEVTQHPLSTSHPLTSPHIPPLSPPYPPPPPHIFESRYRNGPSRQFCR